MKMSEDDICFVNFHINAQLGFGQSIRICGNIKELGMDNQKNSLELVTTPEKYPVWYNQEPLTIPVNSELSFVVLVYCGKTLVRKETETPYKISITQNMDIIHTLDDSIIEQVPSLPLSTLPPTTLQSGYKKYSSYSKDSAMEPAPKESNQSLLLVSQFLPINLKKTDDGHWEAEFDELRLLAGITWKSYYQTFNSQARYVGCIPLGIDIPEEEQEEVESALRQLNCFPVFLKEDILREHYHGFCKKILWPVIHNSVDILAEDSIFADRPRMDKYFSAYSLVNDTISKVVAQVHKEDEIIWIQGYQLMLVPSSLSRRLRTPTHTAFIFHTPFPSSDVFRLLPWRDSFLYSLLSVNHIAFHLYEYLRHFANAVRRLMGVQLQVSEKAHSYFEYNGRHIMASSSFMGIEHKVIQSCMKTEDYKFEREKLQRAVAGRKVFVTIAYLERLKGLPLQLQSIKRLLEHYPSLQHTTVFVIYGLAAVGCSDFESTRDEVSKMINDINQSYNTEYPVIHYQEVPFLTVSQRAAIWSIGDILVCSAIREGMNAFPLEYVAVHASLENPHPGIMILSEFTASARVLSGALYVNPWSTVEVEAALAKAIVMSEDEKEGRFAKLSSFVMHNPTSHWIQKLLQDIESIPLNKELKSISLGFGYDRRLYEVKPNFRQLNANYVGELWKKTKTRAVFLDYGGTLVDQDSYKGEDRLKAFSGKGSFRSPPYWVQESLTKICGCNDCWIFVVSGRSREEVEQSTQGIPYLGLASEEGYFYRFPGKQWLRLTENYDEKWREVALSLMKRFCESTNGSFIETKESAVLWQFKDADPDFGQIQARELEDELALSLSSFDVDIVKGRDYVQVRAKNVNKGVFVTQVLESLNRMNKEDVEFVLCIGDDTTDESMFVAAQEYASDPRAKSKRNAVITCTVGNKPSEAEYYVNDVSDVHTILETIEHLVDRLFKHDTYIKVVEDLEEDGPVIF